MSKFIVIGKTDCKKVDVKRFEYGIHGKNVSIFIAGKKEPEFMSFRSEAFAKVWVDGIKSQVES